MGRIRWIHQLKMIVMTIKAPYNFVPVNEKVVSPCWAESISHDIPFADARSGVIKVKATAHSPVFVRNGALKSRQNNVHDFSQFEGKYFIPGTSLKGMVRNVLEVLTFSKMGNKVNDHRYAIRDLSGAVKDQYLSKFRPEMIYAGWLVQNVDESYSIEDCDIPGRISHRKIDEHFGTDFSPFFSEGGEFDQRNDDQKSARFKYNKFGSRSREVNVAFVDYNAGRKIYEITADEENAERGTLVFTGQPGPRKQKNDGKWTGHHLEFIFFNQPRKKILAVDQKVIENFFFAYFDHDKTRWSKDWAYWREDLKRGDAIPVFFHKDDNQQVSAIGLSYLFKLPYEKSVTEAMPSEHRNTNNIDFSEALFGFVDGEEGLKGRVHFGHAFALKAKPDASVKAVLSSPKASYYPTYIRQQVDKNGRVNGYQTFMHTLAEIAGWKRYPVHKSGVKENPKPPGTSEDVLVEFVPLETGSVFEFAIHYHNLKEIELGALLSALTFHMTPGTYHSLGMAKPLGYGKVLLEVEGVDNLSRHLSAFEAYMSAKLNISWHQCEQIIELITMASDQETTGSSELAYMKLDVRGSNEFTLAKNAKEALGRFSQLDGIQRKTVTTMINGADIVKANREINNSKALYSNKLSQDEYRNIQQRRFYDALEEHKETLRKMVREKLESIEKHETEVKKKLKAESARQGKPNWDAIDLSSKNAFDELKKTIKIYTETYYGKKYDKMVGEMPNGVLPEQFRDELREVVIQIIGNAPKKEKGNWQKPFEKNADLKKVSEWIGETQAREIKFS